MDRQKTLQTLQANPEPEVLIVGAGINGAGTFRDLALNGVEVLIIDRADFCSGASAASSHMAHGGIRYLENGEFRLVQEAVRERNRMIENAPHLVRPLPTTIPIFKIWSGLLNAPLKFLGLLEKPSERGAIVIKIGLMLYDAYTASQGTVPRHKFNNRETSRKLFPQLNPAVRYTATYYDGAILSPERYLMELILDAEAEGSHARALNYVSLLKNNGDKAVLKDELTGEQFEISPRLMINAAGPWIDQVNSELSISQHYIGGTKGSHLVLDHPGLRAAIGEDEFFFENKDGRIVLIFPFFDKVLVGTSDIPIEDPDLARCTDQEVEYFFEMIGHVFPDIQLERDQIVFRFSGVRPLEYSQAKTTGQITRDHSIKEDRFGDIPVYSLVGGKWTSYRAFAELTTDRALDFLGKSRGGDTRHLAIGGGLNYAAVEATPLGSTQLFKRYGSRAREVSAYQDGREIPLKHYPGMTLGEIAYLCEKEHVVHLDDLILRRTLLAFLGHLNRALVGELAGILAEYLNWSAEEKAAEVERTLTILHDQHGISAS
jgi:glycerol-3-phosphate dehydrogenase